MLSFFSKKSKQQNTKNIAKDRLRAVLEKDRKTTLSSRESKEKSSKLDSFYN